MALRLYSLFATLFLLQSLQAQSVIMIADETKTGFKLIVEGFIQNEVFLEKLNIKGLPEEAVLFFEMKDGRNFRRKLPTLEKGKFQYVIYEDFKGKLRFRYRGKHESLKQSALMFKYKKEQAYSFPDKLVAQNSPNKKPETALEVPDSSEAPKTIATVSADEIKEMPKANPLEHGNLPKTSENDKPKVSTDKVSSQPVSKPVESSSTKSKTATLETKTEEKVKVFNFEESLAEIQKSNFEFDKVQIAKNLSTNASLTIEQLNQVLKSFKYDQSRLEFLKYFRLKQKEIKLDESILNAFEYELSKQAAQKIIKPNDAK